MGTVPLFAKILQDGEDMCLQTPYGRQSHPAYSDEQWARIRETEADAVEGAVEAIHVYQETVNPGYKLIIFGSAEAITVAERKNRIEQDYGDFPYSWL